MGGTKWPLPPKFPVPQDWWGGWRVVNKVPGHTEGGETEEAAIYKYYEPPEDPPDGLPDDYPDDWPYPPTWPPPCDWAPPFPEGNDVRSSHEVPENPPPGLPNDWPPDIPYPPSWPPPDDWYLYEVGDDSSSSLADKIKKLWESLEEEEEEEEIKIIIE